MKDRLDQLLALLADERAAILAGKYDELAAIGVAKVSAIDGLSAELQTTKGLTLIRATAKRNQLLLAAALRGVRQATSRVAEIAAVQEGCRTYDRTGQAAAMSGPRPQFTRRA